MRPNLDGQRTLFSQVPHSLAISGPLWTGPLHKESYIVEMLSLAEEWGWIGGCRTGRHLEKLLKRMIDESDPKLPVGYIKMDEVSLLSATLNPPSIHCQPVSDLFIVYRLQVAQK